MGPRRGSVVVHQKVVGISGTAAAVRPVGWLQEAQALSARSQQGGSTEERLMREHWNERYRERELVWSAEPNRFLVEEIRNLPQGRALDLGCGEGRNAVWLAEQGWDVTAGDFSDVAIDKGRAMAQARGTDVDWVVADITDYGPEPEAFDLVLVAYVHLPPDDMAKVWEHAASAVRPGGTLLVIGHHRDNLDQGVGGPQHPAVLYTEHDVVTHLDGFVIERAEPVLRPVERDGETHQAIDLVVRARRPLRV